jgi:hypothetical protein
VFYLRCTFSSSSGIVSNAATIGITAVLSLVLVDLVVLALAVGAAQDAWFEGDIFEELRAYLEARDTGDVSGGSESSEPLPLTGASQSWWMRFLDRWCPDWVCHMLLCRLCSRYHFAFWLAIPLAIGVYCDASGHNLWAGWLHVFVFVLAAIRIATIETKLFNTGPDL